MLKVLKACPECGYIQAVRADWNVNCPRCKQAGHLYRLLGAGELEQSIQWHRANGYREVAIDRAFVLATLHAEMERG